MTISSTTRIAGPYTGSGTTGPFTFAFKVFQASDLVVVKREISTATDTTLTLTTDYSVTLNGNQNSSPGGSITLVSSISSAYELTLTSNIENKQPTDLTNQGGFYPEVITDALDRACIQIQQLASLNTRSLVAPISDGLSTSLALPAADLRANKYLAFDANGVPMAADGTDTPNITSAGNMTITANNAGSNVARDVIFYDNATETMRIKGSGATSRLGVGTSTPAGYLSTPNDMVLGNQATSGSDGTMRMIASAGVSYIQSGLNMTGASAAPTIFSAIGGGAEWMRVTSTGVGVGISPASRLHVHESGATNCNVNLTNGTSGSTATDGLLLRMDTVGQAFVYNMENAPLLFGTNATEKMQISASGNVGIGTTPAAFFHVNGTIRYTNRPATGTITAIGYDTNGDLRAATSSLRYKHDVQNYQRGLADISALRPVAFKFNGEERQNAGFIAEEIDALGMHELMLYDDQDRPDGVLYANMVAMLTKGIQELKAIVDAQAARIAALEANA
jgi:hypothetical protein